MKEWLTLSHEMMFGIIVAGDVIYCSHYLVLWVEKHGPADVDELVIHAHFM